MSIFEAIRLALGMIRAQKLKSFFSAVGVLIGVMFLIAVVSIVQGMNEYMRSNITDAVGGVHTFNLRQRPNFTGGDVTDDQWRDWMRRPRITYEDAGYIRARLSVPATFANYCSDRMAIWHNGKVAKDITLEGTEASYFELKQYKLDAGRPFSAQEVRAALPVVVLGQLVAERLFEGKDPLGKKVTIAGIPYRVLGVVEPQGTIFGLSKDKFAIMPYTAPARRHICPINVLDQVMVRVDDPTTMNAAIGQVEAMMRSRRHLRPGQENNFTIETAKEALSFWDKISTIMFMLLPGLVAISLVVGGIVIMNIMLMAVAERTREIGIRKALGARRRDILAQFVVESATLATVGAATGIALGVALAFVVKAVSPLPAAVATWSIGAAVALGMLVGIVAGVYPAYRAAKLDPITALRAE